MKRSKFGPFQPLQVAQDIVPIGELKAHLSEKIRELRERRRPFIVTQNGKAAAVLVAPEDYDLLTSQVRLLTAVHEGLEDDEAGRVFTDEELTRFLDEDVDSHPTSKKPKSKK